MRSSSAGPKLPNAIKSRTSIIDTRAVDTSSTVCRSLQGCMPTTHAILDKRTADAEDDWMSRTHMTSLSDPSCSLRRSSIHRSSSDSSFFRRSNCSQTIGRGSSTALTPATISWHLSSLFASTAPESKLNPHAPAQDSAFYGQSCSLHSLVQSHSTSTCCSPRTQTSALLHTDTSGDLPSRPGRAANNVFCGASSVDRDAFSFIEDGASGDLWQAVQTAVSARLENRESLAAFPLVELPCANKLQSCSSTGSMDSLKRTACGRRKSHRQRSSDHLNYVSTLTELVDFDDMDPVGDCGLRGRRRHQPIDPEYSDAVAAGTVHDLVHRGTPLGAPPSLLTGLRIHSDSDSASLGRASSVPPHPTAEPDRSVDGKKRKTDTRLNAEINLRVARARQTMDYVNWQLDKFSRLSIAHMSLWDGLSMLDTVDRVPGDAEGLSLQDEAFHCANLCHEEFPDVEWAPLVGLIHNLGRLLQHPMFGSEPLWGVTGESYPLGCQFSSSISGHSFFSVCPDRRRRIYTSPTGIYSRHCGLENVYFTWSAAEYLFTMLLLNDCRLPPEALFLLRYQHFDSLVNAGAYGDLLSDDDVACLPLLRRFRHVIDAAGARRTPRHPMPRADLVTLCQQLMDKYMGSQELDW